MIRLLFLDINNVLSSRAWRARRSPLGPPGEIAFEPGATMALRRVLAAVPGCGIVVSSTWRTRGMPYVRSVFAANGLDPERIVGLTPMIPGSTRGDEIRAWLAGNPWLHPRRLAIVDDRRDMGDLMSRAVIVQPPAGLTDDLADRVVDLLRSGQWPHG